MQKHDNPARSYVDLYKSHLEVLEFADQAGMDFYFVAEHHFDMGFSECPSPGSFLGAASQRTKTDSPGPAGIRAAAVESDPRRRGSSLARQSDRRPPRMRLWCRHRTVQLCCLQHTVGAKTRDDAGSFAHYQRASGPMRRSASRAATSSAKTSTLSIPLVQKPHPPLWMPTRSKDSIEEAASTGVSTVQWVPAGDESGAQGFRRISRGVSTDATRRSQTAHRLDA